MKIMINYDLIDKVREAKTGFSLNECVYNFGMVHFLVIPTMLVGMWFGGAGPMASVELYSKAFRYITIYTVLEYFFLKKIHQEEAIRELDELSVKLGDICFKTDTELLKGAYQYDVKYEMNFDAFPPKLMQKKYIMVPIYNEWGDKERSLMQEHVIGTRSYALSYGEPEGKKVKTYVRRKNFNNVR